MIYLWRLEGSKLVLNLREIFRYPELAKIYNRDLTKNKDQCRNEFRYIDMLANRESYPNKEGFNEDEAHAFSVKHCGLAENYKPDATMLAAINKAKELNGGVIEDLIDSTVAAFHVDAKLMKHAKKLLQDMEKKVTTADDVAAIMKLTEMVINMSNVIPTKVNKLLELREMYDKQVNGAKYAKRGGGEITDSYDGDGFEKLSDTGQVERLD